MLSSHRTASCASEHLATRSRVALIQRPSFLQLGISSQWLWAVSVALHEKENVKDMLHPEAKSRCIACSAIAPTDIIFLLTYSGWHKLRFIS